MLDIKSIEAAENNKIIIKGRSYDWTDKDLVGYLSHYSEAGVTEVDVVKCNNHPGGDYLFHVILTLSEDSDIEALVKRIPEEVADEELPVENPKDFTGTSAFVSDDDAHLPDFRRLMGV